MPGAGGARERSADPAGVKQANADWECTWCGFAPNFGRRRFCFDCSRPRARAQGAAALSGATAKAPSYLGPVGADGRRPQLAWGTKPTARQVVDEAPTRRTPGASAAALAEEARRRAACPTPMVRGGGAGATSAAADGRQGSSKPAMDKDGFITVGRKGKPAAPPSPAAPEFGRQGSGAQGNAASGEGASGAPSDCRNVTRDDDVVAEGDEEEEEGGCEPGPEQLRRAWLGEVALVKRLAKQGMPEGHPAIVAAHEARDAAEAAWRKAKQPAPAATRLRWAQEKLSRALELQEASRAAIDKAEAEHAQLMERRRQRHSEDVDRVRKRRKGVDDVQEEIGLDAPSGRTGNSKATAMFEVCGGLCNSVGHGLVALVEMLQDGSAERQAANRVLSTLADSQRLLEEAAADNGDQHQTCDTFDIGDDEDAGEDDAMSETTAWSESHEVHGAGGGTSADNGNACGLQSCAQAACGEGDAAEASQQEWNKWAQRQWHVPQWQTDQHGKWHRASWADQWEAEHMQDTGWATCRRGARTQETQGGADGADSDNGEPSTKHRRQGKDDCAMASAGASASTVGTAHGKAEAASYAAQVEDIVNKAIAAGVQPLTETGAELITLSPEQLSQWVNTNLDPKFKC